MKLQFTACLLLFTSALFSQGSSLPFGNDAYHILDRLEIKTGRAMPYHSSLKYFQRGDATQYALSIDTAAVPLTVKDRRDLYYIFKDNNDWLATPQFPTRLGGKKETVPSNNAPEGQTQVEACLSSDYYIEREKPIFNLFYKSPANFLEVNHKYFHLRVNPILNFRLANSSEESKLIFLNQRGIEFRGGIDDRIYFHTNIIESQARFPDYVNGRIQRDLSLPGNGLYKSYKSNVFDITDGYDYLNGQAYVGFNVTRHVGFQIGHGSNFIGNGYRSLILSDFANNYFYLKINWRVWKFHYQNIFAELAATSSNSIPDGSLTPKKYMASHHLSFNISPNLNIGFFETTVFNRDAETGQFEFQYLNPIILYRTVEQFIGSPDNVLIGFDFKWNLFNRLQLYSQLMLDEFKFNELIVERNGWWANKFGIQAGLKYIDAFGLDHLDLQGEFNTVRPFTYSHRDSLGSSYTHYNQPLAHPLGSNFREFIFKARYQPLKKLVVDFRAIHASFGEDEDNFATNWGSNPLLPHTRREKDYGNEIGQGIAATTTIIGLDVSYQIWHNLYLELEYFRRKKDSDMNSRDLTTSYMGGGVRMNIGRYRSDY